MSEQQPLLQTGDSRDSTIETSRSALRRFLNSKTGHYSVLLLVSLDVTCIFADFIVNIVACEKGGLSSGASDALEALSIISLIFSCLFMVELLASIWAFGFKYFESKFHCFDALVIIAGFVVDVLLHGVLEEVASLVVILRLWRVFKIMEELSVGAQEEMEGLYERVAELEKENEELQEELQRFKASDEGDGLQQ